MLEQLHKIVFTHQSRIDPVNKAFIGTVGFGTAGYTGSLYANYVIFTNPQYIASDFSRGKMIFSN